jgi:hypothetical protein
MRRPILVLQYPDSREGRLVALASTRNAVALQAFREAVLEDARLAALDWRADDVLLMQEQLELERLEKLLGVLIPSGEGPEYGRG